MAGVILTLNSGSSSLKFALYQPRDQVRPEPGDCILHGAIESCEEGARFSAVDKTGKVLVDQSLLPRTNDEEHPPHGVRIDAIMPCLEWIEDHLGDAQLSAVGHRILHGGSRYLGPTRLSQQVLADLADLIPFGPLHQPACLAPASVLAKTRPDLPQIACFDTAFHQSMPDVAKRLPLPRRYDDAGIRRYGFHGLSYAYIAGRLSEIAPDIANGRVIVAHLGNGASLCALRNGASVETTMSLTALDGLVMGTRCGTVDPGAVIYLAQAERRSPDEIVDILYRQSGLLGVSGVSSDMRELREAASVNSVRQALELFTYRVVQQIGALTAVLGGLDGLVFTAGIGEHDAVLRRDICAALGWLGVVLDEERNARALSVISADDSRVRVFAEPTNENLMICRAVCSCLGHSGQSHTDGDLSTDIGSK
mgnify:CR=1 FL=1